jgi:hypothetical protein
MCTNLSHPPVVRPSAFLSLPLLPYPPSSPYTSSCCICAVTYGVPLLHSFALAFVNCSVAFVQYFIPDVLPHDPRPKGPIQLEGPLPAGILPFLQLFRVVVLVIFHTLRFFYIVPHETYGICKCRLPCVGAVHVGAGGGGSNE